MQAFRQVASMKDNFTEPVRHSPYPTYLQLQEIKFTPLELDIHHYYNVSSTKIRRNESYKSAVVLKQNNIFELDGDYLVSRFHVEDMKIGIFSIYISVNLDGPWILVEPKVFVPHGKERIIKVGSLPCSFVKLVMKKGTPFLDFSKIKIYGMTREKAREIYGKDAEKMLFEMAHEIIYRPKQYL